ncbi:MAG: hypothetical protein ACOYYJ_16825 [Chloroflexota bacterium]
MQIHVKLIATYRDRLPPGAQRYMFVTKSPLTGAPVDMPRNVRRREACAETGPSLCPSSAASPRETALQEDCSAKFISLLVAE